MPVDTPVDTPEPKEVRSTFATKSVEYMGELRTEKQKLQEFGDFLTTELEEGARLREEESEDAGFFGTLFSIIGAGLGCIIGSSAGPAGCVKGATIGAGAGSLAGRFGTDIANTAAEKSGLSEEELASLSPAQFQLIQEEFHDLHDDAVQMQQNLDNFDDNQWKAHVLGAVGDTWNAYKIASLATDLGFLGGEELVEDLVEEEATNIVDLEMLEGSFSPGEGGFGWSSGQYGGQELLKTTGEIG